MAPTDLPDGDCLAAGKGYGDVQFLSPPRAEHRKDDSVGSDTSGVCMSDDLTSS
ncbi:MAG: hypothetical protein WAW17_29535 [Rhodococcus sp. (in: high G+C Gram-positive bacteria)]|uniref:hypothetical protein n=1 Tax=Rhodococcus sp. TaxID=1831 RepID=UPI003BB11B92